MLRCRAFVRSTIHSPVTIFITSVLRRPAAARVLSEDEDEEKQDQEEREQASADVDAACQDEERHSRDLLPLLLHGIRAQRPADTSLDCARGRAHAPPARRPQTI